MNSPEHYIHKLNELGFSNMKFSISNIEEAKQAQKQAREAQKQLRQLKKDLNLDIKELRSHFRQKSSGAGSGSSAAFQVLGKKKLAGQVRAEAKRNVKREKDSTIAPYERVKYSIDDLLAQLDNVKVQAQSFIEERKEEIASLLEELRTLHYQTPIPANEFIMPQKQFPLPEPKAPPPFQFDQIEPVRPTKREGNVITKLLKPLGKKLEDEYQERLQKYQSKLKDWQESKEQARELYEKEITNYQARMVEWNSQKQEFDENEKIITEKIRAGEPQPIEHFLIKKVNLLVFPMPIQNTSISVDEDLTVVIDVNYPLIEDWPILSQSDTAKRKDYVTHLHSIAFRMIGEAFGYLPNITNVKFSGYFVKPSKKTGNLIKEYIFSTIIERKAWEELNFSNIEWVDVVECFGEFETRRKITKTGKISEIVPF